MWPRGLAPLFVLSLLFVPLATGQDAAFRQVDHSDVLFTPVTTVHDVELVGEEGYLAATTGGLVIWAGDGARKVLTRLDGLPSTVVWTVTLAEGRAFVGTEFGFVLVGLDDHAVEPLTAEGLAGEALEGIGWRAEVVGDTWYALDRDGRLAVRENGAWTAYDKPPGERADDLYVDEREVLVAMDEAGVYQLAENGTWTQAAATSAPAIAVARFDDKLFVGTRDGGLEVYDDGGNRLDVSLPDAPEGTSVLTFQRFGDELWIGTTWGIAIVDANDEWRTVPARKVPHPYVGSMVPLASKGTGATFDEAVLGLPIGVAWPAFDERAHLYELHTTTNGPTSTVFTGSAVRNRAVWVGTDVGVSIFHPDKNLWDHIGAADGLEGTPVYAIEHSPDRVWMGTRKGIYGLHLQDQQWLILTDNSAAMHPRNLYYDVEPDGDRVWMPQLGNGLLEYNLASGQGKKHEIPQGLLSHALTCAERWHEFLAVCTSEAFQLFNLTQVTEATPLGFPHDYCPGPACGANYPADNTFTALADGSRLWTGTIDEGVVLLRRVAGEGPEVVDHWGADDGLPSDQVRALAPAPNGVWVGTDKGLALLDLDDGIVDVWDRDDGMDSPAVAGLSQVDHILYVSTLSGLYRLDTQAGTFLPLVIEGAEIGELVASLRVSFPPDGATLHRSVNMTGTAAVPGRGIERVEAQVDGGPWTLANGTTHWRFLLPVDTLEPGEHAVHVRALAGEDVLATAQRTIVVERATQELVEPTLEHTPPRETTRGAELVVSARVGGEAPLAVSLEALLPNGLQRLTGRIVGGEASFPLQVPADATGDVAYRFHVQSGAGELTVPSHGFFVVPVREPRVRQLAMDLSNATVELAPGESRTLTGTLVNEGNRPEEVRLAASGLHPDWLTFPTRRMLLVPGQPLGFEVEVAIPANAQPGTTVLLVNAQGTDQGLATSQALRVSVTGEAAVPEDPDNDAPLPALPLLLVALALAAARRRRQT